MTRQDTITLSAPIKWALGIASTVVSAGVIALVSISLEQQRDIAVIKTEISDIQRTTRDVESISREVAILQTQVQFISQGK